MANFKTSQTAGTKNITTQTGGEVFPILIEYTPSANLTTVDVLELFDLPTGVQVLDYLVVNAAASLVGSLGVLNAGKTALLGGADTWATGVAAFGRAGSGNHLSTSDTAARSIGFIPTVNQTAAGKLTFVFFCRCY